ncbi:hypothetical protein ACQ4PT_039508 [Festuca glaucescens]
MDCQDSMVRDLIQGDDRSKWIAQSNHNVKCFTQEEMIGFTNNFETVLGRGAFGEVYGVLEDKTVVAVKRFINNVKENFAKELIVHRQINHKNVVRLVGYCLDENALMMATEYIPKGNLSDIPSWREDSCSLGYTAENRHRVCRGVGIYLFPNVYSGHPW